MKSLALRASRLPWMFGGIALGLLAATIGLTIANRDVVVPGEDPWNARLVWALLAMPVPAVGALIASRRRDNPYGWVWLVMGLGLALLTYMSEYVIFGINRGEMPLMGLSGILSGVGWSLAFFSIPVVLLLYPTGRPPSRRWHILLRFILVAAAVAILAGVFLPTEGVAPVANPIQATGVLGDVVEAAVAILTVLILVSTIPAAVSLAIRYRSANPVERAQIKWFMFAALVFVGMLALDWFWEFAGVAEALKEGIPLALLPVAVAVAILKYRLYDIDRIISRTVAYAIVTVLLAWVYVSVVFLIQRVLPSSSDLAVAASTLAVAAAFNPLRRRVQELVDRRFNRSRYNASRTVEGFSRQLREAGDPSHLYAHLQATASQVLQPAHVSLWLRDSRP